MTFSPKVEQKLLQIQRFSNPIASAIREQGACITSEQLAELHKFPDIRLMMIMVRCGCGRFIAPLQDVAHFVRIIDRDATAHGKSSADTDYVRDASLDPNL